MPEGEGIEEDPSGEAMQVAQAALTVPASAATPGMSVAPTSQPAGLNALRNTGFMPVGPTPAQQFMPELQFLTQFPQLFSMHPLAAMAAAQPENAGSGRSRTGDAKSTSAYASRHQAAEQRRRTRINERLDRLREVVPHPDRANTAAFLETVIDYVTMLKNKVTVLEAQLQAAGQQTAPELVNSAPAVQAPTAEVMPYVELSASVPATQSVAHPVAQPAESQMLSHLPPAGMEQKLDIHALAPTSLEGVGPRTASPATPDGSFGHEAVLDAAFADSAEGDVDGVPFKKRRV